MLCISCSKDLPASAKFCKFCGAKQEGVGRPLGKALESIAQPMSAEIAKKEKANTRLIYSVLVIFIAVIVGVIVYFHKQDIAIPQVAGPMKLSSEYFYKCAPESRQRNDVITISVDKVNPYVLDYHWEEPGKNPVNSKWLFQDNDNGGKFAFRYKFNDRIWMIVDTVNRTVSIAYLENGSWKFSNFNGCKTVKK